MSARNIVTLSHNPAITYSSKDDDFIEDPTPSPANENVSWISWFCSRPGREYFVEVREEFIEDLFNLTGLNLAVPFYNEALDLILDRNNPETLKKLDMGVVETSAQILYGLIHQRYIITRMGLHQMAEKYSTGIFGCCPRVNCCYTHVLPAGRSDVVGRMPVVLFCPNCLDLYAPSSSKYKNIDGSFFGTTFPHLFFETYPELNPKRAIPCGKIYQPRIYGFKVSEFSKTGPRMHWLRMYLTDSSDSDSESESESD
ncbi:CK2 family regulatory subunit [Schizosaccharomyces cryophilus OY26]|uniref:Casein kinase II subunit beta n=1 Tax=Schizosaccharomyces cryophilus (strain OY26 / ATCC MYA-4695 / CBS 11777 / NBRC 106824 / NRRL Y48691) TaxID=653667 RepID=S9VZJ7_SCHCR|nr:CK2 family regulatory subunit [Schizosaccharomyces cryophilus OY26]EPY51624.1 CK2 family regulatory subunit [Schizosaccharomyces cryophilus OY26]